MGYRGSWWGKNWELNKNTNVSKMISLETDAWKSWLCNVTTGNNFNGNKYFSQISLLEYFHLISYWFLPGIVAWPSEILVMNQLTVIFYPNLFQSLRDCKGHKTWILSLQWHKHSCFQILKDRRMWRKKCIQKYKLILDCLGHSLLNYSNAFLFFP